MDDTVAELVHTSDNSVDFSGHYVDLVVPEIPYIACKHNGRGAAIIERIPLDVNAGSLLSYSTHSSEVYTQNYFYSKWNEIHKSDYVEFILPLENIEIIEILNSNNSIRNL